jgi:hypothetical protein
LIIQDVKTVPGITEKRSGDPEIRSGYPEIRSGITEIRSGITEILNSFQRMKLINRLTEMFGIIKPLICRKIEMNSPVRLINYF